MTEFDNESPVNPTSVKSSPLDIAVNIFTSPHEAFAALKSRPTVLFPLLIICLTTAAVMLWYYSLLDLEWYVDDLVSSIGQMGESDTETLRATYGNLSRTTLMLSSSAAAIFGLVFMYLLQAGYLTLASALSGDPYRFKHWFSLVCWTSLPYLLTTIGMAINVLLNPNGQISSTALDPLSLANLGMTVEDNFLAQTLFSSISLTMIWGLVLMVIGHRQWLDCSLFKSIAIVTAPYALIFGAWAYFALR